MLRCWDEMSRRMHTGWVGGARESRVAPHHHHHRHHCSLVLKLTQCALLHHLSPCQGDYLHHCNIPQGSVLICAQQGGQCNWGSFWEEESWIWFTWICQSCFMDLLKVLHGFVCLDLCTTGRTSAIGDHFERRRFELSSIFQTPIWRDGVRLVEVGWGPFAKWNNS